MEENRAHPFADVYRIREELSEEYLALTAEEHKRRINEETRRLAAQYGFSVIPAPQRRPNSMEKGG